MIGLIRRLLLYCYIALLPYCQWNGFELRGGLNLIIVVGLLYSIVSFIDFAVRPPIPFQRDKRILYLFIWILIIFANDVLALLVGDIAQVSIPFVIRVAAFICIFDHLFRLSSRQFFSLALIFSIAVSVQFPLFSSGIGVDITQDDLEIGEARFRVFGNNANGLAMLVVISTMLYVYYLRTPFLIPVSIVGTICNLGLFVVTASRGGLISLFATLFIVFFFSSKGKKLYQRILIIGVGAILLVYLVSYFSTFDIIESRFEEDDFSGGRIALFKAHFESIGDHPLLGAGLEGHMSLMINKYHVFKQSHNGFLDVITATGLLGGLLFYYVFFDMIRRIVRGMKTNKLAPYLAAFFFCTFFDFAKSGGVLETYVFWVSMAILLFMTNKKILYQ